MLTYTHFPDGGCIVAPAEVASQEVILRNVAQWQRQKAERLARVAKGLKGEPARLTGHKQRWTSAPKA